MNYNLATDYTGGGSGGGDGNGTYCIALNFAYNSFNFLSRTFIIIIILC